MNWEDFRRDHHRPHLLEVKLEVTISTKLLAARAVLERLVLSLGTAGNYAFETEGTTVYVAFEEDADAGRFAMVFRTEMTTRDSEWASKTFARLDDAAYRRITRLLGDGD
ncbi:hypothetical protein [Reyranella soli]|nr:hypothetical protein [Reyranella soli]